MAEKPWAVELVTIELRKLLKTISELSGKPATDEALHQQIVKGNRARQLAGKS